MNGWNLYNMNELQRTYMLNEFQEKEGEKKMKKKIISKNNNNNNNNNNNKLKTPLA